MIGRRAAAVVAVACVAMSACGGASTDAGVTRDVPTSARSYGTDGPGTTAVGAAGRSSPGSTTGTAGTAGPGTTAATAAGPGPAISSPSTVAVPGRSATTRPPVSTTTDPVAGPTGGPSAAVVTSTQLSVTPAQVTAGEPITLRATVRADGGDAPRGAVTFLEGSFVLGSAPLTGDGATFVRRGTTLGNHTYSARYGGWTGFAASTSAPVDATIDPELFPPPPGPGEYAYWPQVIPPYEGFGPKVVLVGDSITYYDSYWFMEAAKAAGFSAAFTGMPGYRLSMIKPWIDLYAATSPKVVIVNLGTNDIVGEATHNPNYTFELFKKRMDVVAKQFARQCLVVTTITSHRTMVGSYPATDGYTPEQFNALARQYNDHLRSTFAHVADWDAVVAVHPDYVPDGIHPLNSAEGLLALADVQVKAAQGC